MSEAVMFSWCSDLVLFIYWTGNSVDNLLSYCGLVDARISASVVCTCNDFLFLSRHLRKPHQQESIISKIFLVEIETKLGSIYGISSLMPCLRQIKSILRNLCSFRVENLCKNWENASVWWNTNFRIGVPFLNFALKIN